MQRRNPSLQLVFHRQRRTKDIPEGRLQPLSKVSLVFISLLMVFQGKSESTLISTIMHCDGSQRPLWWPPHSCKAQKQLWPDRDNALPRWPHLGFRRRHLSTDYAWTLRIAGLFWGFEGQWLSENHYWPYSASSEALYAIVVNYIYDKEKAGNFLQFHYLFHARTMKYQTISYNTILQFDKAYMCPTDAILFIVFVQGSSCFCQWSSICM